MPAVALSSTEQKQAEFYARVHEGYDAAAARTGEVVRNFRLAGTYVRVRFAGNGLVPALASGLAHRVGEIGEGPLLEICVWDSESTGVPLTPPPRSWEDFTTRGNIWGFDSSRYRSAYHWGENSVNVMDRDTRRAVYWAPSHRHMPLWAVSSPLRSILHWWMELNNGQLIHGAAVGCAGRGVLIPGKAGAGKSSTSLTCLANGLDFVADDYLALTLDPEPRAHSLYCTAKVERRSLHLFPGIAERCRIMEAPGFDKAVLFIDEGFQDQFRESLAITRVFTPRISGKSETTLGSAAPQEIERALASGTLMHLPHVSGRTVEMLSRASRELPLATIHLGSDRPRIAVAIREALSTPATKSLPDAHAAEARPYVSAIVHFRNPDHEQLEALADSLHAQRYPRLELVVMADASAAGLRQNAEALDGNVYVHVFDGRVPTAVALNRAIRESFSEFLLFLEPGDSLFATSLDDLLRALQREDHLSWVIGKARSGDRQQPLHGGLVRKDAFRKCGLFEPHPFLELQHQRHWLDRAAEAGLAGRDLDKPTFDAAAPSHDSALAIGREALRDLKENFERRHQQTGGA